MEILEILTAANLTCNRRWRSLSLGECVSVERCTTCQILKFAVADLEDKPIG